MPSSEILRPMKGFRLREEHVPTTLSETMSNQEFHPELTAIGKNHPITRIVPNKDENERHWKKMPELEGLNI